MSMEMRKVALGVLVLLSGCASSRFAAPGAALQESVALESPAGRFRIDYAPGQEQDAARVQQAVTEALPRLERWGTLREPVTIKVMPDHASLEAAVRARGFDWLRAWSRYDKVFVQAPSTWGAAGATQPQINELLLHELTHSVMYQMAADRRTNKEIPLWFREGMASYTAEQSYRWVSLEEIARHFERTPGSDPVRRPGDLYRDDSNLIYGVAHHAFAFLVKRYGEDAVRGVLREMDGGKEFPRAFENAIGLAPDAFERDFTRYVRWRGFRGGRVTPGASAPPG
ncbi:peptidase MA family metallohydrolase [Archangium gephyra]|uniref:peptidase MA family metallohydrolase n=1 Tax=Archangium gephyra TaxID=48 RepID=UPI003B7BBA0C